MPHLKSPQPAWLRSITTPQELLAQENAQQHEAMKAAVLAAFDNMERTDRLAILDRRQQVETKARQAW